MNLRFRVLIILAGALAVVATFTFPAWQRWFERDIVDETFPGLSAEQQAAFEMLPQDQQNVFVQMTATDTVMAVAMVNAALAPPREVPEAERAMPEMQGQQVAATGEFIRISPVHWAEGRVTIYQLPDNSKIMRFEDFSSANGPDLRVVLSASDAPETAQDMRLNNLDLEIGRLKGNIGSQNYTIPPQIDLRQYNSVVIYCRSFGVIFSYARI
jgi:hypothetical protein